jgi:hypothetical protein
MFEVGRVYNRRLEIHQPYGGQRQGGISTPRDWPFIFLFTGEEQWLWCRAQHALSMRNPMLAPYPILGDDQTKWPRQGNKSPQSDRLRLPEGAAGHRGGHRLALTPKHSQQ